MADSRASRSQRDAVQPREKQRARTAQTSPHYIGPTSPKSRTNIKQHLTHMSDDSFPDKSSKAIVQLATNSSGGMAASWNTVNPIVWPLCTSVVKSSFQVGLTDFCFVVVRATGTSSTSTVIYGSITCTFFWLPTWCRVAKSVGRRSTASHIFRLMVPLKKTIFLLWSTIFATFVVSWTTRHYISNVNT